MNNPRELNSEVGYVKTLRDRAIANAADYREALAEISDRFNEAAQFEDWPEACEEMAHIARKALNR